MHRRPSTWLAFPSKEGRQKMNVEEAHQLALAMPLSELESYGRTDLGTVWFSGEHNLGLALARAEKLGHTVLVSRQQPYKLGEDGNLKAGGHHHASYKSITDLYPHATADHHLFEVIPSTHTGVKPFFDFDFAPQDFTPEEREAKPAHIRQQIMAEFAQHLNTALTEQDVLVADSSTAGKCSYHVLVNGVYLHSLADNKHLAEALFPSDDPQWTRVVGGKLEPIADRAVYTRNQHLRGLGQSKNKPGAGIKRPYGDARAQPSIDTFRQFWVTDTTGCKPIDQPKLDALVARVVKERPAAFKQLTIPQCYPQQTGTVPAGDHARYLALIPNGPTLEASQPWSVWQKVMYGLRNSGAAEETARAWSAKSPKHNEADFRRFWKQPPRPNGYNVRTLEQLALQANPGMRFKPDVGAIVRPTQAMLADPAFKVHRISTRFLDTSVIDKYLGPAWDRHKSIVIRSQMGTGKSCAARALLALRPVTSLLIISPRQTFGEEAYRTYKALFPDLQHYMEHPQTIGSAAFAVIQVNSLHKITRAHYGVIILDECESVFDMLTSSLFEKERGRLESIVERLELLIRSTKHVLYMDAFIQDRTLRQARHFDHTPISVLLNEHKPYTDRLAYPLKAATRSAPKDAMAHRDALEAQGKKVVFISGSQRALAGREAALKEAKDKRSAVIHSGNKNEVLPLIRQGVNEWWSTLSALYFTCTITVGIDFDVKHFDTAVMSTNNTTAGPRDMMQALFRVRHYKDNTLYYNSTVNFQGCTEPRAFTRQAMRKMLLESQEFLSAMGQPQVIRAWLLDLAVDNYLERAFSVYYHRELLGGYLNEVGYQVQPEIAHELAQPSAMGAAWPEYDAIPITMDYEALQELSHRNEATAQQMIEYEKQDFDRTVIRSETPMDLRPGIWNAYKEKKNYIKRIISYAWDLDQFRQGRLQADHVCVNANVEKAQYAHDLCSRLGLDSTWAEGATIPRNRVLETSAFLVENAKRFSQLFGMDESRTKNTRDKPANVAISKLQAWLRHNTPCELQRDRKRRRVEGEVVECGDYTLIANPKINEAFPVRHMHLPRSQAHGPAEFAFVD